jgi:hypothetical protein
MIARLFVLVWDGTDSLTTQVVPGLECMYTCRQETNLGLSCLQEYYALF